MLRRVVVIAVVGLGAGCLVNPDHSLLERDHGPPDQVTGETAWDRNEPDLPNPGDSVPDYPPPDGVTLDNEAVDQGQPTAQLLAVRSGSGSIADLASSASLSISPALADVAKTLLVFQATSDDATPDSANVRCFISGASTIDCDRVGTIGTVLIRWYTAEFTSGVKVQHLQPSCDVSGTTTVSIATVAPSKTFLIYSGRRAGVSQDDDDLETVRLVDATTVEIRKAGGGCSSDARALQVVELDGASVDRGVTGAMSGTSLDVTGLAAADTTRTLLLYSYRGMVVGPTMCDRMVRGAVASSTMVSFSRGSGASGCDLVAVDAIAWERVELPPGVKVQQLQANVSGGTASVDLSLAQVDLGRTLALSGGQWTAGQGIGEGSLATNDILGAMVGRHEIVNPTTLRVTRGYTGGKASWSAFVVEF